MQTVYTLYNDPWALGQIADTSLRQVDSFLANGAVGIGKPVVRSTDPARQCAQAGLATGQAALIFGIALASQTIEQSSAGVVQYADKDTVPVMRKGRVVVETATAVVAGAPANYVYASGKWDDAAVAAGVEAPVLIRARFVTATAAAGLAVLEIDSL